MTSNLLERACVPLARASLAVTTRAYVAEGARAMRLAIHAGRALRRERGEASAADFAGHLFIEVGPAPKKPELTLVGLDPLVSL